MKKLFFILLSVIASTISSVAQEYDGCELQHESGGHKWYRTHKYINGRLYYGILDENRKLILEPKAKFVSAECWNENMVLQLDLHSGHKIIMQPNCEQIVSGNIDNCSLGLIYDSELNNIKDLFYITVTHRGTKYAISKDYQIIAKTSQGSFSSVQLIHSVGCYYLQTYNKGVYGAWADGKEIFPAIYQYTGIRKIELNGECQYYAYAEDKNGTKIYKSLTGETIPDPYKHQIEAFTQLKNLYKQRGESLLANCDYVLTFKNSHTKGQGGKLGICNEGTVVIKKKKVYRKTSIRAYSQKNETIVLSINVSNNIRLFYSPDKRTGKTNLMVTAKLGSHPDDVIILNNCTNMQIANKVKSNFTGTSTIPEIRLL